MNTVAAVQKGRIVRFHFVCNRFVKAFVSLYNGEGVYCLVPKVSGTPIFDKGVTVAYIPGPLKEYKGHQVRGEIAAWADMAEATEEDLADAADWGVR